MPDDVKQDRWDRFMAHQQAISSARLQLRIGREIEVLVDEVDEQGAVGRCFFDAPEIDGNVFIDNGTAPDPDHPMAPYAADLTYIVLDSGHINCFAKNEYSTMKNLGKPMVLQSGSCL